MTAAAAATAGARILRGRPVSLVVPCAFLLGALWLASARSLVEAAGRCYALEGCSSRPDYECLVCVMWPSIAAFISLSCLIARWVGEVHAVADLAAGGSGRPDGNLADALIFLFLYFFCAWIMLFGKILQDASARRLQEDPADVGAACRLIRSATYHNAGVLCLYVVHCCFSIPYFVLRLMWFLRDQRVGSKSD
ncbi:hypothetical protein EJB05_49165, partial [Eragrostis curvula]